MADFFHNFATPVATRAPLVADTPEQRRFRAAYLDDDLIVPGWSDTLVVTAQG
ncbi:MAG: hypothetical protein IH851_06670 [Armatimonadetes bacterium]|nr:hypothetical protein [Armatimonadota bacterium]